MTTSGSICMANPHTQDDLSQDQPIKGLGLGQVQGYGFPAHLHNPTRGTR